MVFNTVRLDEITKIVVNWTKPNIAIAILTERSGKKTKIQ